MVEVEFKNLWKDKVLFLLPTIAISLEPKEIGIAWLCFSFTIYF